MFHGTNLSLSSDVDHRSRHIWESDTNTRKHNTHKSQEVSPLSAGDYKAARNRQDSTIIDKHETQTTKRIHK